MPDYDLFNGDADGICALQQLRLSRPLDAQLVTGLKRDINLFARITPARGDSITALDVSFDRNRDGVRSALEAGARVFYADHHYPGELIDSANLELHIDTDANVCTSLIINRYLNGTHHLWALCGTYGDNLYDSAESLADQFDVPEVRRDACRELGVCLNYNGYGFTLDDLIFHPADLYKTVHPFHDPMDFIQTAEYERLRDAYRADLEHTRNLRPFELRDCGAVYILPDAAWARRVNGVLSNDLARSDPDRANAVLVECGSDCYRVSVRAPLRNKHGADDLCRQFESGGGRKAAAGINRLPASDLDRFTREFFDMFTAI